MMTTKQRCPLPFFLIIATALLLLLGHLPGAFSQQLPGKGQIKSCIQSLIDETNKAIETKTTGKQSGAVQDCEENFTEAVEKLQESLTDVDKLDVVSLNVHLSAASTAFTTCQESLAEMDETSPLVQDCQRMEKKASGCLAMTKGKQ